MVEENRKRVFELLTSQYGLKRISNDSVEDNSKVNEVSPIQEFKEEIIHKTKVPSLPQIIKKGRQIIIIRLTYPNGVLKESDDYLTTYLDFIKCLNESYDYQILITEPDNDYYGICKAIVGFHVSDKVYEGLEDYQYEINFNYDPRDWGYCQCTSDMEDYREDKCCCGHGCDWWAPAFEMRKSFSVGSHNWNGDEHNYWEFEDEFYKENRELAEKEANESKEREIKELKARIEADTKKLAELENR
jgi:hypothetical protein